MVKSEAVLMINGLDSLALASHLHFQLSDTSLQSQKLLLQSCFFSFQRSDLLLNTTVFGFLKIKMSLPVLIRVYISSSMRTSSLDKLFLTSAVFMVSTDSSVSFSLRRIWTSFLWLLSSLEMFLICCWMEVLVPRVFEVCLWGRRGWSRSCCRSGPFNFIMKFHNRINSGFINRRYH